MKLRKGLPNFAERPLRKIWKALAQKIQYTFPKKDSKC